MYRICINMPVEQESERDTVQKILDAAAKAGAGNVGAYSRVAALLDGNETWLSGADSHPYNGIVGEISVARSVRIEMQCPEDRAADVIKAVRALHPYEEPVIELVKLEPLPE